MFVSVDEEEGDMSISQTSCCCKVVVSSFYLFMLTLRSIGLAIVLLVALGFSLRSRLHRRHPRPLHPLTASHQHAVWPLCCTVPNLPANNEEGGQKHKQKDK